MAVHIIAQRTQWQNVAIALPAADGAHWVLEGAATRGPLGGVERMSLRAGIIGRAYTTLRTQVVTDVAGDPDYVCGLDGIRSELATPIRRGDANLGVLNLESDAVGTFGPEDAQLAESLADAVGLALENASLYGALAEKHRRLQELEQLRDDLTHTMVHDLRNPLTSVGAALEMLDTTPGSGLSQNVREMVRLARSGANRMSRLVDSILEVSRLESGSVPLDRRRLALGPLVVDALEAQVLLARDKGLELVGEVSPDVEVFGDPAILGRVLQNLVGNAVKFAPAGGRIRVEGTFVDGGVRVAVQDDGPGIDAAVQARLFQKFFTGGHRGQGSGLGLAFCRLAVEAHGGRIWVESAPGQGATFTFTLPAG